MHCTIKNVACMYDLASKVLHAMATIITDLQIGVLYHVYKYIKYNYVQLCMRTTLQLNSTITIHTNFILIHTVPYSVLNLSMAERGKCYIILESWIVKTKNWTVFNFTQQIFGSFFNSFYFSIFAILYLYNNFINSCYVFNYFYTKYTNWDNNILTREPK